MNSQKSYNNRYEINMIELFGALFRRWWIILLATVAGALALFVYTRLCVTPLYQSSVSFYVNNGQRTEEKISNSDISAAQSLVDTYIVILKYGNTLDEVVQELDLDCTSEELAGKISCSAINDTEIFRISVTDPSPERAKQIALAITKILPRRVADVIDGSTVRIVRSANDPVAPVSPKLGKNVVIGAVIGFFLSALSLAIHHVLDDRIRDASVLLRENYPYPVLAAIPDLMDHSRRGYYSRS